MKDTINIVTSFNPKGWETYAKKMIDSVVKYMADDLHLTAYYHDFTDEQIDAYIDLKFQEIYKFEHTPHPIEFEMYYSQ